MAQELVVDPQWIAKVQALLEEVYEAGRRDGSEATRLAILKAVEGQPSPSPPGEFPKRERVRVGNHVQRPNPPEDARRAPRGLLRQAIEHGLRMRPGLSEQDLQDIVVRYDSRISPRSVGGELRRMRGTLYRQEGRRWFLLAQEPAAPGLPLAAAG